MMMDIIYDDIDDHDDDDDNVDYDDGDDDDGDDDDDDDDDELSPGRFVVGTVDFRENAKFRIFRKIKRALR